MTDGDLLRRLYQKDISALEVLYDRYSGYVYGMARRLLSDATEAEETTQDVFWQLWKGQVRYDAERARFSTWLFTITRSRCLDRLRSRGRRPRSEPLTPDSADSGARSPETDAYLSERRQRVQEAIRELPPPQKQALELCFYQGMTHREVADHLREPLGTVKSRIKMGMDKLKLSLRGVEAGS